jgi:hypothetical protein
MKWCPHCNKPSLQESGTCPRCGKDMGGPGGPGPEAPEPDAGAYGALSGTPDDEELQLETAIPIQSQQIARGLELSASAAEGEMELELGGQAASSSPRPPPVRPTAALEPDGMPDPLEVQQTAEFGPGPKNIIEAPGYALRVRRRIVQLEADVERLSRELKEAEKARDEALSRLGERARVAGYSSPAADRVISQIDLAEQRASGAQEDVEGERDRHRERLQSVQERIERVKQQMARPRQVESGLAGQLAAHEEQRRRIEARRNAVETEIRAAEAAIAEARKPAVPGAPPAPPELHKRAAEAEARMPHLHAAREEARTQASHLDGPIAEIRTSLAAVRAELEKLEAERKSLLAAIDAEKERHKSAMSHASTRTEEASRHVEAQLADLGKIVRAEAASASWAEEMFAEVDRRIQRAARVVADRNVHVAATKAFDAKAVQMGYVVIAAGVAVLLLGLLGLVVALATAS